MENITAIFKKKHTEILVNKYTILLDTTTMKVIEAFKNYSKGKWYSRKCATLIKEQINFNPSLKNVDFEKLGMVEIRRKLSSLPLEQLLVLEHQLKISELIYGDVSANSA